MKFSNRLSPAEVERLALVAEEAAEVVQVAMKILRHGYESHHPQGFLSNRQLLEAELGDLDMAKTLLVKAGDITGSAITIAAVLKVSRVMEYTHHQPARLFSQVAMIVNAAHTAREAEEERP
jgi:hypothetical protein